MAGIELNTVTLERLQALHALNESTTARAIGCDRATLRRIKDGASPSAAFIAGAILTFNVPFESLFAVSDQLAA
ncbi:hypothetical protein DEU38_103131 [Rhodococcus sp. AG1013]|uniref:hypothetical protein n=1 Tax=Rhodococcus sp. AG1013 TaxID=2183996 RepID=UPI000E2D718B|nr:hypothetical protein [Rhodococcus sp. AG1013]RDI32398.1 hypothetical protein DEU38_103131 [Rhodococcus sp. AG1013]